MTETAQSPTAAELAQWRAEVLDLGGRWDQGAVVIRLLDALEAAQREAVAECQRHTNDLLELFKVAEKATGVTCLPTVEDAVHYLAEHVELDKRRQRDLELAQAAIEDWYGTAAWLMETVKYTGNPEDQLTPLWRFVDQVLTEHAAYDAGDAKREAT